MGWVNPRFGLVGWVGFGWIQKFQIYNGLGWLGLSFIRRLNLWVSENLPINTHTQPYWQIILT